MKAKKRLLTLGLKVKPSEQERLFEEIYWSKASKIKKQSFFLVGPNLYEDAVQEVFIKIFKGLKHFQQKSSLDTWIYRITLNTCLNLIRKNKGSLNEVSFNSSSLKVEEIEGVDPIKRRVILTGIEKLNDKHRSVFVLFFIMELKISEITEVLDIKEGTVKSRIHKAKNEMKEFLTKEGVYNGKV